MCWAPVFQQVGKVLCSAKCVYPTQHHKQTADIIMNNIEISWIDTLIVLDIWYDCVTSTYILQELSIYSRKIMMEEGNKQALLCSLP